MKKQILKHCGIILAITCLLSGCGPSPETIETKMQKALAGQCKVTVKSIKQLPAEQETKVNISTDSRSITIGQPIVTKRYEITGELEYLDDSYGYAKQYTWESGFLAIEGKIKEAENISYEISKISSNLSETSEADKARQMTASVKTLVESTEAQKNKFPEMRKVVRKKGDTIGFTIRAAIVKQDGETTLIRDFASEGPEGRIIAMAWNALDKSRKDAAFQDWGSGFEVEKPKRGELAIDSDEWKKFIASRVNAAEDNIAKLKEIKEKITTLQVNYSAAHPKQKKETPELKEKIKITQEEPRGMKFTILTFRGEPAVRLSGVGLMRINNEFELNINNKTRKFKITSIEENGFHILTDSDTKAEIGK